MANWYTKNLNLPTAPIPNLGSSGTGADWFAPLANSPQLQNAYYAIHGQYYNPMGGGGGGGGNPASGILADYLNQMRTQFGAQSKEDAASRDAALRRMVISYGAVPDFAAQGIDPRTMGFLKSAITPDIMKLAQQNTDQGTSVVARLMHDNALANRRIPAVLAGRGLLHSGQTGSDLAEQALNYKTQGFDTLNNMLNQATGVIGNYLQAERDRQMQLAQMEMNAAMQAWQGWGDSSQFGPPSGFQGPVPPGVIPGVAPGRGPARPGTYFGTAPGGRRTPWVVDPRTGLPRGI